MTKTKLNIGLVGAGFMGRTHSNAFRQAGEFFKLDTEPVLKAVATRNAQGAADFAANWGFESSESDWRKLIERKDIDLIDIASPNDTHAEIAIAAAQAGKMVMCEKPLGRNAAEAEKMVAAVEAANVPNMVWYNYRRVPAVTFAKQMIDEGRLGRIFHYRAKFLQDWTISADVPQGGTGTWRLDANVAGSGVTGDLLAHCIDTALWLNGSIDSVTAATETFVKQRTHAADRQGRGRQDRRRQRCSWPASTTARSRLSRRPATRAATRRSTRSRSMASMPRSPGTCMICIACRSSIIATKARCAGWRSIHVTDGDHPYMSHWWVPGLQIGYEHTFIHQAADFIEGLSSGKPAAPTFRDALKTDYVTDAVLASAKSGRWEQVRS